jgi:hypothetical protein
MGQPRVVIGVDAAEAEFFADFLEGHDCAAPGLGGEASASNSPLDSGSLYPPVSGPQPVMANGSPRSAEAGPARSRGAAPSGPVSVANGSGPGSAPAPRDVPSEPMARLIDDTDPLARTAPAPERPITGPQAPVPPVTRAFPAPVPTFTPIGETRPGGFTAEPGPAEPRGALDRPAGSPPDVMTAELAGWASGELPGQASEQMASWAAADAPGGRALDRSRSAR